MAIWLAHDFIVAPRCAIDARAAVFAIDAYRARLSPQVGRFVVCRFKPTCSQYGREAILKYGFASGAVRTAVRIARCGPWTPAGTIDRP